METCEYKYLAAIESPDDLKKLTREELPLLAEEIRREIIRVVTVTGGHLASSLGAVELITALHYVFDAPKDKIVFDVGHQAYAHKIITGRLGRFSTIRQAGGLSGFPSPAESEYDAFSAGHASTSVSAALGLAAARDLTGGDEAVVAVIGDGALTGGMALEGLNHAGHLKKKMIVILNDNRMSIGPNVGALASYLSLRFTSPDHIHLRERVKNLLQKTMPRRGRWLIRRMQRAEVSLKSFVTGASAFFETLGFKYIGPIDGHNVPKLIDALNNLKTFNRPVLLHVLTTKGKGYSPAEDDPCRFHGVGVAKKAAPAPEDETALPLAPGALEGPKIPQGGRTKPAADIELTLPPKGVSQNQKSATDVFGETMLNLAEKNAKITAITAAMCQGTGLEGFFAKYPQRSFDVGIAEQHAVTYAAGLAKAGLKPVVAMYSTFLQRAFDQLFHDVALQNLPVVVAVDRAGLVGEDGPTHHGAYDLSYLRLLPNFTVMAPKDGPELAAMLEMALNLNGPVAIRYPRGALAAGPDDYQTAPLMTEPGRAELMRPGGDVTIVALGATVWPAWQAARLLGEAGVDAGVINARFIKPLDSGLIARQAALTGRVLTVEDNSLAGGLFGAVGEALGGLGLKVKYKALGLDEQPLPPDTQSGQRAKAGLDTAGIYEAALLMMADQGGK